MSETPLTQEVKVQPRSDFDGGAFKITALTKRLQGFVVETGEVTRRRPTITDPDSGRKVRSPLPFTQQNELPDGTRVRAFNSWEERLKSAIQGPKGEMSFNKVNEVISARDALKEAITEKIDSGELNLSGETGNISLRNMHLAHIQLEQIASGELDLPGAVGVLTSEEIYQKLGKDPEEARKLGNLRRFIIETKRHPEFMDRVPAELKDQYLEFEEIRKAYIAKGKKIGLRNIRIEEDTITGDPKIVNFTAYTENAYPGNNPELLDLSEASGIAAVVETTEIGRPNRLLVQHRAMEVQRLGEDGRTRGNRTYLDQGGASFGGLNDATLHSSDRKPGTPDRVNSATILAQSAKEGNEEVGLRETDIDEMIIDGLTHDEIKPHDVLLVYVKSNKSAQELNDQARETNRNRRLGPADFEEKFVDIEASPEAIRTLVTKVRCPLPADHAAAYVAAGYLMVLKAQGIEAADEWKTSLEPEVQENYRIINETVQSYYRKNQDASVQIPERFWGKAQFPPRNLNAYSPDYSPEEQGLKSFEDAMVEAGLLPETRKCVYKAYIFDVDGIPTDSPEIGATESEFVDQIVARLQRGEPVGITTEQSTEWLVNRYITPILGRIEDKTLLQNFVAIGEQGGSWVSFDRDGILYKGIAKDLIISKDEINKVKRFIDSKYGDSISLDNTKKTIISANMQPGTNPATFYDTRIQLAEELDNLLARRNVLVTTYLQKNGVDIRWGIAGGDLVAQRFQQLLRDNDINPDNFEVFGSSKTDFKMADELARKGRKVKMIFIGDRAGLGELVKDYPIDYRMGYKNYGEGTIAYLEETDLRSDMSIAESSEQRRELESIFDHSTVEQLADITYLYSSGSKGIHEIVEVRDPSRDGYYRSEQYAFGTVKGEDWVVAPRDDDSYTEFDSHMFLETRDFLSRVGYEVVEHPEKGDVVGYCGTRNFGRDEGKLKEIFDHFGIYNGSDVTSKFGTGNIYRHGIEAIPFGKVDKVVFFRKTST